MLLKTMYFFLAFCIFVLCTSHLLCRLLKTKLVMVGCGHKASPESEEKFRDQNVHRKTWFHYPFEKMWCPDVVAFIFFKLVFVFESSYKMEQLKINCFISTEGDWVHMWKKYLTWKHCQTCQCSDIDIRSFISRHTAYDVSKNWWPLSSSTPPSTRALVIKLLSFRIKASPVDLSGESSHPPHLPVARMTAPLFGCVPKLIYF